MRHSLAHLCFVGLALAMAVSSPALAQTVIYVDADASGADDGSSWTNAYTDLQDALGAAGTSAQIWVAQGSYTPTDGTDRAATFQLKSGVALYGGFVGTETSVDQRNPNPFENRTGLSCNIGDLGTPIDNCYHVVSAMGVDQTAILDGFSISSGYAREASPHDRGAGLSNYDGTPTKGDGEGYPTLRNLHFGLHIATYGAGVYLNGANGTVTFENVTFELNTATLQGGGMYVGADLEMESVAFIGNTAESHGGGAWFSGGESVLRNVRFALNELESNSDHYGAGVHVRSTTRLKLVDVVFERNRVSDRETGHGGALDVRREAEVDIVNAAFVGNTGRDASGILVDEDAVLRVTNAVFAGHGDTATQFAVINGFGNADVTLTNVTMSGNQADYAVDVRGTVPLKAHNLIVWGNSGVAFNPALGASDIEVDHAIIEGGYTGGTSVLADDPLFVRQPDPGADGTWGTADDDYGDLRLRPGSPGLDAGNNSRVPRDDFDLDRDGVRGEILPYDLAGVARVQNGRVDLGAYEDASTATSAETDTPRAGVTLSSPAPNPARGLARLTLTLETPGPVEVGVHDLLGRQLVRLHEGPLAAGEHAFEIDGAALPAGVYVVRASSAQGTATRRMTVVR